MPNWKDKGDILFISAEYEGFVVHAINKCERPKRDTITRYVSSEFFRKYVMIFVQTNFSISNFKNFLITVFAFLVKIMYCSFPNRTRVFVAPFNGYKTMCHCHELVRYIYILNIFSLLSLF